MRNAYLILITESYLSSTNIGRSLKSQQSKMSASYHPEDLQSATPIEQQLNLTANADRRKRLSSGSSIDPRKRSDSPTILDLISIDDDIMDATDVIASDNNAQIQSPNAPLSTSCPNNMNVLADSRRQLNSSSGDAINQRPSSGTLERRTRTPSVSISNTIRKPSSAINSIQYKSGYAQIHQQTTARKQVNCQVDA